MTNDRTYMVIQTGYEGIDEILGLHTRLGAVRRIKNLRRVAKESRKRWGKVNPDMYCVQHVTARGSSCACRALGVSPSKPMLR